uniref:Uncharacterized protein n=1 Tax=Wuchereria bancrofti TaxID=6293 RepID=A0A1I8ER15_WUCBA
MKHIVSYEAIKIENITNAYKDRSKLKPVIWLHQYAGVNQDLFNNCVKLTLYKVKHRDEVQ